MMGYKPNANIDQWIDPFSDAVKAISLKFDESTINQEAERIEELLIAAEILLKTENPASQAQLYYSIGTVYSDFSKLKGIADEDSVKKQLYCFRKSIELIESDEYNKDEYRPYILGFKENLYTNYGNILDRCGRKIAAIDQYKKALNLHSSFGMALGNLGMAYHHYGMLEYDPAHRDYFHHFAYSLLNKALQSNDPNTYAEAKESFKSTIDGYHPEYVEKVLKPGLDIPQYTYDNSDELEYRQWALDSGLFLNTLNDLPVSEFCFAADVIQLPNMLAKIVDKPIFHGMFNQIKQEYVYARYLYYGTLQSNDEPHFADKDTYLLNFADYPQYSIRIEQLKSSFKTLYGLFDKIAYFINSYFKLGIKEKDVSFRSIWWNEFGKGKNKYTYQNILDPDSNFALSSLYWISRDFFDRYEDSPNPNLKRLSDIRNALEHKYVKIVWGLFSDRTDGEIDDLVLYISESELYEITLQLLKIVREAILCLSLCVNIKETTKKEKLDSKEVILPLNLMSYDDEWKT